MDRRWFRYGIAGASVGFLAGFVTGVRRSRARLRLARRAAKAASDNLVRLMDLVRKERSS